MASRGHYYSSSEINLVPSSSSKNLSFDGAVFKEEAREENNPRVNLSVTLQQQQVAGSSLKERRKDIKQLLDSHQQVLVNGDSELVVVEGARGVGKSSLVAALESVVAKTGLFCRGKFHPPLVQDKPGNNDNKKVKMIHHSVKPYDPLIQAMTQLVELVQQSHFVDDIRQQLLKRLDQYDISILGRLVPSLLSLLQINNQKEYFSSHVDLIFANQGARSLLRFKLLCQRFWRAVASSTHPLVVFFDDLHHADEATLEILMFLWNDIHSKFILFVCSIDDRGTMKKKLLLTRMTTTFMNLQNLSVSAVHDHISELLCMEHSKEKTSNLARLLFDKTEGNPLHINQLLQWWESKKYLTQSQDGVWSWDLKQCESSCGKGVKDIVMHRARHFDSHLVLAHAACLGFHFHLRHLEAVMGESSNNVEKILTVAEDNGIIRTVRAKEDQFQFAHDLIYQAIYRQGHGPGKQNLHYKCGKTLQEAGIHKTDKNSIFIIVNNCNLEPNPDDPVELAVFNAKAGRRALSLCAYHDAKQYFSEGIRILDDSNSKTSSWQNKQHYSLTLDLYAGAARASHQSGDVVDGSKLSQHILLHATATQDKLPAYITTVDSSGIRGNYQEAIRLGLLTVRRTGVQVPRSPGRLNVVYNLIRVRAKIKGYYNKKQDTMRLMKDPNRLTAMHLLSSIVTYAIFQGSNPNVVAVAAMKMVLLTINHGLSEFSPQAFALYGWFESYLGHLDEAKKCAIICGHLMNQCQGIKEAKARSIVVVHCFLAHLGESMETSAEALVQGYRSGITTGQIELAIVSYLNSSLLLLQNGEPLPIVCGQLEDCHSKAMEFHCESILFIIKPLWQSICNLMGRAEDVLHLTGEAMNEVEMTQQAISPHVVLTVKVYKFFLLCWLTEWKKAALELDHIYKNKKTVRVLMSHFTSPLFLLFSAMCDFASFRNGGNVRNEDRALKAVTRMEQMHKNGAMVFGPFLPFARAERLAIQSHKHKKDTIVGAYRNAIFQSEERMLHLLALANERLGDVLVEQFQDNDAAEDYWNKAKVSYESWGASAKVDAMHVKLNDSIMT